MTKEVEELLEAAEIVWEALQEADGFSPSTQPMYRFGRAIEDLKFAAS